jgi:hypothetical protein
MVNRLVLDHRIRIATVLALLAGVMTSSSRSPRATGVASRPGYRRDHLAVSLLSPRVSAASVASRPIMFKALPAEGEEELNGMTGPDVRYADPPSAIAFRPQWILAPSALELLSHPLRC